MERAKKILIDILVNSPEFSYFIKAVIDEIKSWQSDMADYLLVKFFGNGRNSSYALSRYAYSKLEGIPIISQPYASLDGSL